MATKAQSHAPRARYRRPGQIHSVTPKQLIQTLTRPGDQAARQTQSHHAGAIGSELTVVRLRALLALVTGLKFGSHVSKKSHRLSTCSQTEQELEHFKKSLEANSQKVIDVRHTKIYNVTLFWIPAFHPRAHLPRSPSKSRMTNPNTARKCSRPWRRSPSAKRWVIALYKLMQVKLNEAG